MNGPALNEHEWHAYQREVWHMGGNRTWVDVDTVAEKHRRGRTTDGLSMGFVDTGNEREPLLHADRVLRGLMQALSTEHVAVLRRWLHGVCKMCPDTYLGIRFPPCFIALMCDIVAEAMGDAEPHTGDVTPATSHPLQVYSLWVRFGILSDPSLDEITEGWETVERNLLMQQSNRFTPDVFTFWTANRSVEPAV